MKWRRFWAALKARNPQMRRAVVKLNEGFSGEGCAQGAQHGVYP